MDMKEDKTRMILEEMVDNVIAEDLKLRSDFHLSSKVMSQIGKERLNRVSLYQRILRVSAVAASILISATLGIYIGRVYSSSISITADPLYQDGMLVDDSKLENLYIID